MMGNTESEQDLMPLWKAYLFMFVTGAFTAVAFFSLVFGVLMLI